MHEAFEIQVLVARGRRIILILVRERSKRLLFHEDFRDGVATIRAKAKSGLLASYDRRHVMTAISMGI